ncbi:hypothetical protein OGATHE_002537 [Ogataea polymorpha]|uniref:Uncharacterized protein n=1 Tax=Ogataea polymorpha TaxID=460523 RepID=A0A9P8T8Y6_9ASCO|nr:hypothetical protein OGATHE_002537 [Ogataea polymorpha]
MGLNRHHWEVLDSWDVSKAESRPDHWIVVSDIFVTSCPNTQSSVCLGLIGEFSGSVEFIISIFGNPDLLFGDWVDLILVNDLVRSVGERRLFDIAWLLNNSSFGHKSNVVWVQLSVFLHTDNVVKNHGVFVTVNSRINPERKHMLVVSGHNPWADVRAPRNSDVLVQRHGGENAGSSNVDPNLSSLVENDV